MASRPFFAARLEQRFHTFLNRVLSGRYSWREAAYGYVGYGSPAFVRVLGRIVLSPQPSRLESQFLTELIARRGWRNFFNVPLVNGEAVVTVNGHEYPVTANRSGYIDVRIEDHGLDVGWHQIQIRPKNGESLTVDVNIIAADQRFGLVSDIDDTIITTSLPRPFIAAWNTFVLEETARTAVPGMSELYRNLQDQFEGAPVFYVSTGAWNTAPTLGRFLRHHRYPVGPMLLTDWGPTNTGWFRSGQDHKRVALEQLARDFPRIRWMLVGDDGQHDPTIYTTFAQNHPDRVAMIAIRQLTPTEQVLAHGSPLSLNDETIANPELQPVPVVSAPEGYSLGDIIQPRLDAYAARHEARE